MSTPERGFRLVRESFGDRPAFGAAVSRAVLERVAGGQLGPTVRMHRTGRVLAFGRRDATGPGFGDAVAAARSVGFEPIVRMAGGRAAVYHEGTVALSVAVPGRNPAVGIHARFERLAARLAAALRRLGVEARIGEVPGEYCPGEYSVNARGRSKLAGIGQRIVAGGAYLGAVIVVRDSALVRAALVPVYEALALDWDPATAGSVEDELGAVELGAIEEAILRELSDAGCVPVEVELDATTLQLAERLEADHRPPA